MIQKFHFVFFLLALANCQSFNSTCNCNNQISPVCYGGERYINQCVAACSNIFQQNSLPNPSECPSPTIKIADTIVNSGQKCKCNLVVSPVCVNDTYYPNPCFAHCQLPKTNYGNYKNCPAGVLSNNGVLVNTSNQVPTNYPININCNCPFQYSPICVDNYQYSNSCFAACYRPGKATSQCAVSDRFIKQANNPNCFCIFNVSPVCVQGRRYANECIARCDYQTAPLFPC